MHRHVRDSQKTHENRTNEATQKGLGAWLTNHRRPIILLGAAITLTGYFLKDVSRESVKDDLAGMNAGAAEYRTNLPVVQQQTTELVSTLAMVGGDTASLQRDKVLVSIASLTYRQELNANEVFAFWKNVPEVPTSNVTEIKEMVDHTAEFTKKQQIFAEHPGSDAQAFQTSARSMVTELVELNDRVGKTGADLQLLELQEAARLQHKSSLYGLGITTLYLFGLVLTVVSSLYGVEVPTKD